MNMSDLIKMKVAHDNGNSASKIVLNGVYTEQPNGIVNNGADKVDTGDWQASDILRLKQKLIVGIETEQDSMFGDGKEIFEDTYFVGTYALNSGKRIEGLDIKNKFDKIDNDITLITTNAYIAAEAVITKFKELKAEREKLAEENGKDITSDVITLEDFKDLDEVFVNVDLSTAIPARIYKREVATELAKKFLYKFDDETQSYDTTQPNTFRVRLYLPDNQSVMVNITYSKVNVIQEGVTATHFLINAPEDVFAEFNEEQKKIAIANGKEPFQLTNDFFKNEKVLHVAIGEGTTELPITEGLNWDSRFITGIEGGIGHAMESAIDVLSNSEISKSLLNPKKLSLIIKQKMANNIEHKFFPEISRALMPSMRSEASKIVKAAMGELNRDGDVNLIIVYGGGSIMMQSALKPTFQKELRGKKVDILFIPKKYAVKLEAFGLYSLVSSKNFKSISID